MTFTMSSEKSSVKSLLYSYSVDNSLLDDIMKYIGVLRDTTRAPKPTSQKHAIPFNGIGYHKIS